MFERDRNTACTVHWEDWGDASLCQVDDSSDSLLDANSTIGEIKNIVFAQEIARGTDIFQSVAHRRLQMISFRFAVYGGPLFVVDAVGFVLL